MKSTFTYFVIVFLSFWGMPVFAQTQDIVVKPFDEAAKDPSFMAYRAKLLTAVKNRDTESVITLSSPQIELSFGGDSGHDRFREFLNVPVESLSDEYKHEADEMRAAYWSALEQVLENGGKFNDENEFIAPYTFAADIPENLDAFETYFVMGTDVLLRNGPDKDAPAIDALNHNIVIVSHWAPERDYQNVKLPSGKSGYISAQFLRSLVDYRAIFAKTDRKWEMQYFIAGD